jgi:hypothetical protein
MDDQGHQAKICALPIENSEAIKHTNQEPVPMPEEIMRIGA